MLQTYNMVSLTHDNVQIQTNPLHSSFQSRQRQARKALLVGVQHGLGHVCERSQAHHPQLRFCGHSLATELEHPPLSFEGQIRDILLTWCSVTSVLPLVSNNSLTFVKKKYLQRVAEEEDHADPPDRSNTGRAQKP